MDYSHEKQFTTSLQVMCIQWLSNCEVSKQWVNHTNLLPLIMIKMVTIWGKHAKFLVAIWFSYGNVFLTIKSAISKKNVIRTHQSPRFVSRDSITSWNNDLSLSFLTRDIPMASGELVVFLLILWLRLKA